MALRDAGAKHNILMGAAVANHLLSNATAKTVLAREYSSLTAENVMKFGQIHPERNTYSWGPADALVAFAQANDQKVHGHTLLWHTEMPSWANASDLEPHIRTIVGRYKGKIHSWDVVNEVMGDDGKLRNVWYRDLVAKAFRVAHEVDPNAILYINDYNIEDGRPKSDAMYNYVKGLLAEGVPIHGVGFQCHFHTGWTPSSALLTQMKRFAALGLRVSITEFDCAIKDGGNTTTQATQYSNMMKAALAVGDKFDKFTTWGFTDASTWLPGQNPLPFTADYKPKPAYNAMIEALEGKPGTPPTTGVRSVQAQQEAVNALGYTPKLAVDGDFGPLTEAGVMWLQEKVGVTADGVWGPVTEAAYKAYKEPTPPASSGPVTAAKLRAMATGGTKVSNGSYNEGSTGPVSVMQKNSALHWTSGMSIDCDGQPGSLCNKTTDPYFQPNTSYNQSDGKPLNAETLPFIVVPLASSIWNAGNSGVKGGMLCTIVYKEKYVHAVVGDQGPTDRIGEASYAAAKALGIPASPTSGGVGSGVTYIVYTDTIVKPIESAAEAHRLGEIKAAAWLGVTTVPDTYTVKSGDTITKISAATNVGINAIGKFNSMITIGQSLNVTAPETNPDPTTPVITTYVAQTGDTWSSIAQKAGITVDQLLTLNNLKVAVGSSYIVKKELPTLPTDVYADGLPQVDSETPSAKALQTELKRVGYLDVSVELADNYGPRTQSAVAAFHNDNPQFRTTMYDPQIRSMGWAFLKGMSTGTGKVTAVENTAGRIPDSAVLFTSTSSQTGRAFAEETIRSALTLMGLPVTDAWINGYLTMALRESSYNPNAVNTYDSNAIGAIVSDGYPFQCSRGMWQCIPQTFARYHQAGTSLSIYDPVASCAASINYVRNVYGVANDGSNLASKVQQADPDRPSKGY